MSAMSTRLDSQPGHCRPEFACPEDAEPSAHVSSFQ